VRLSQLKLSDLSPSALASSVRHEFFTTSGHLMQYYSNLRVVYEIESRVNEMRGRDNGAPAAQPASEPQQQQPSQKQQPQAQPSGGSKPGGSARKSGGAARPEQERSRSGYEAPVPVLALFHTRALSGAHPRLEMGAPSRIFSSGLVFLFSERPGNHHKPSERSLV
jgi:hypothetical protein